MRFKPKYNQYELRFLQVLVSRERLSEIITEMYYTLQEHMLWQGSIPNTDGEEWVKGMFTNEVEDNDKD